MIISAVQNTSSDSHRCRKSTASSPRLDSSCAEPSIMPGGFFFWLFHPRVVTALTDECRRVRPRSHKRTRTRLCRSPAGGGLLPNLQAGQLFSYSSYTHSLELTDNTHTNVDRHTHTHRQLRKKKCASYKSIFQGQPASLKNS